VSSPDSFIDEVTEEIRRDRLFAAFRKYGWIGVVIVVGIVVGAGWNEWSKAQAMSRAQAFGDGITDSFDLGGPEERRAALAALPVDGGQIAIRQLLLASDPTQDRSGTLEALDALGADATQPQIYRDLAVLRRVTLAGADQPLADRRAALEPLTAPGRPFRTLALEQAAYLLIEEAKTTEAITALTSLLRDQEAPEGLRRRAGQMIIALGGEVPQADPIPMSQDG
jgi:hypothetical protein